MAAAEGFNATDRAQKRESAAVVLGDVTYHPRRLTNKRLRQIRKLSRASTQFAREAAEASDEYKKAYDEAKAADKTEAEAKAAAEEEGFGVDEVAEINDDAIAEQLPILLVGDDGEPPTQERIKQHLEEDIDARDLQDLMGFLLGGGPDPTPET